MMLRYTFQKCIEFLDEGPNLRKFKMDVAWRMIYSHLDNMRRKSETTGDGLAKAI
jgi:hypothetical protein